LGALIVSFCITKLFMHDNICVVQFIEFVIFMVQSNVLKIELNWTVQPIEL
jgi:hypothetical protein